MASLTKDRHGNLRIKFRVPGYPQLIRESLGGKATRENIAWARRKYIQPLKRVRDLEEAIKLFPDSPRLKALAGGVTFGAVSVGEFARETWLKELAQRSERTATVGSYETILHRWIEPCAELMKRRLAELTPADGAAFVNWLAQQPGSAVMRNKALKQLARILKRARELGLLQSDPLLGLRPFAETKVATLEQREHELGAWTLEERDRLIAAAYAIAPWQGAAVEVAFFTGMRRGELLALQWRDLDFDRGEIQVRRSLAPNLVFPSSRLAEVLEGDQVRSANQHESLPKTTSSRGAIEMLPEVRDALLGQRERLGAAFILSCPWVFPNRNGDPQQVHNFSQRLWPAIVERAGVPYRAMQQTRHTFAVLALQAGANLIWVQRMLRHNSMQMLIGHYLKYAQTERASAEFVQRLSGGKKPISAVSSVVGGPPEGHPGEIRSGQVISIGRKSEQNQ